MRNRSLAFLGLSSLTALAIAACGGSSDTNSVFDAGSSNPAPTGGDATTVNPSGNGDDDSGSSGFQFGDSGSGGGTVIGDASIDCDANPAACLKAVCGDSIIEPGETCDDGNSVSGDGCSSSCQTEGNFWACVQGMKCVDTRTCNQLEEAGVMLAADSGCVATKTPFCGDGVRDPGEACDVGTVGGVIQNGLPMSGCSQDCTSVFAGYSCPPAGGTCTNTWICGDGKLEGSEQCDDGNMSSGDGCSSSCVIESGYKCTLAGIPCGPAACGDGIVAKPQEACDDGNTTNGDGCSSTCQLQSITTSTAGSATTQPGTKITTYNCSALPQTTTATAFTMPAVGATTTVTQAAGSTAGAVGNSVNIAGEGILQITAVTGLVLTVKNPTPAITANAAAGTVVAAGAVLIHAETCAPTVCGNHVIEGTEQCDDGNNLNYDGCNATCQLEPKCPNGVCVSVCGDGLVFDFDTNGDGKPDEACDDGNIVNGDGCSSTCQAEAGYSCVINPAPTPNAGDTLDVPVVYRDMLYYNTDSATYGPNYIYAHPDFNVYSGSAATPDLDKTTLTNGIPTFEWDGLHDPTSGAATGIDPVTGLTNPNGTNSQELTSATDFTDWYADVNVHALTSPRGKRIDTHQIRLVYTAAAGGNPGFFSFDSNCDAPFGAGYDKTTGACLCSNGTDAAAGNSCTTYGGYGGFLPINGEGWNAPGVLTTPQVSVNQYNNNAAGAGYNFSFTTQFRYYFTYDSTTTPTLDFSGDDDVWVFLAGTRTLDLGGLHSRLDQTFTLTAALAKTLGLVNGHVYEVDLFNAERHTTGSNFKLTLTNFNKKTSTCSPVCGDGIRTTSEQCDNGTANATPAPYNGCTTSCTLGPYCGDGTDVNQMPPEQCDDGVNQTTYATSSMSMGCAPGCVKPAYCGDGTLQASYGEVCDDGTANAGTTTTAPYNGCSTTCQPGPHCGDDIVQTANGEVCDNGSNVQTYVNHPPMSTDCAPGCKEPEYCGDGKVDVGYEVCDNGANNSSTDAYGSCTTSCELGPHCGDGILQDPPETCDDGNLVNGDGCSADCQKESGIR